MGPKSVQSSEVWALAESQHGVLTRAQLLALGFTTDAIRHRLQKGRLHPVGWGVYALGRPQLTRHGHWMAAVLGCGGDAALSHESAGALWEIRSERREEIEVSVPSHKFPRRHGITVHRRVSLFPNELTRSQGIPVTTPVCTLVDLATRLRGDPLEAAVNEADKLGLCDPDELRSATDAMNGRPGVAPIRQILDRRTFRLTDSALERRFLPIAVEAGLPTPETRVYVNGFRVDFHWPGLRLVVETDGLRYHRTPAQQARDRLRDQAHAVAGLTSLRFTHAQVAFDPGHVQATLTAVARRCRAP
jgi:very-short-patch-repair endonuclease